MVRRSGIIAAGLLSFAIGWMGGVSTGDSKNGVFQEGYEGLQEIPIGLWDARAEQLGEMNRTLNRSYVGGSRLHPVTGTIANGVGENYNVGVDLLDAINDRGIWVSDGFRREMGDLVERRLADLRRSYEECGARVYVFPD